MENRLIAHSLIENNGKYLLIKRSEIKRKRPITRYIENLQSPLIFSTYSG